MPEVAVGAVLSEVDRREILDRVVRVVVLHARPGAHGGEEQVARAVAIDRRSRCRRRRRTRTRPSSAPCTRPSPLRSSQNRKPLPGVLELECVQHHVPRVGTGRVRPQWRAIALEPIHAHRRHGEAARHAVGERADDELRGHSGPLELAAGAAEVLVEVVGRAVDAVVQEDVGVGGVGIVAPGKRDGAVERGAAEARRDVGRNARSVPVVG